MGFLDDIINGIGNITNPVFKSIDDFAQSTWTTVTKPINDVGAYLSKLPATISNVIQATPEAIDKSVDFVLKQTSKVANQVGKDSAAILNDVTSANPLILPSLGLSGGLGIGTAAAIAGVALFVAMKVL